MKMSEIVNSAGRLRRSEMLLSRDAFTSFLIVIIFLTETGDVFAITDGVSPFAEARISYDSNLFRVSGDEEAELQLGHTDKDDIYLQYGAGVTAELPVSQQKIQLDVTLFRQSFTDFTFLDYTGGYGAANWKWHYDRRWSGNVGYDFNRSLVDYSELQFSERDVRTDNKRHLSGRYRLDPDWSVGAGLKWISKNHSAEQRTDLNKESQTGQLDARFSSRTETALTIYARFDNIDFPDRGVSMSQLDTGYRDVAIGVAGKLDINQYSSIDAWLEYIRRNQDTFDERNFNGVLARVEYDLALTSKLAVGLSVWREIDPLDDVLATQVLEHGFELAPDWSLTSAIELQTRLALSKRDYRDISSNTADREDKLVFIGVAAAYSLNSLTLIELGWEMERRSSNYADAEYSYNTLSLSGRVNF